MRNEISCNIVQDLLPSYVDNLTSEETNQSIEMHMQNCTQCREMYNRMKQPEVSEQVNQRKDIDFLKKARSKARLHITVGITVAVIAVILIVLINTFLIGKVIDNPELIKAEVEVTNKHIVLTGNLTDSSKGVSDVQFENKDGIVHVTVLETGRSSFHENKFNANYDSDEVVSQIWLGDRILWDNGENISVDVAKVFETKHPYIGNMSKNGESVIALGISEDIGNFTNELQTTKEPYGWKLIAKQEYVSQSRSVIEMKMKAYASALIAVIDNLGYVTFDYIVDGKECSLTVTEQDADTLVDQSVKLMAQAPCGLQTLMVILNLSDGYKGNSIVNYKLNSDGTWSCEGRYYKYRMVLTGRTANEKADGRLVVLTNSTGITYSQVVWSMMSSNLEEKMDSNDTLVVEVGGN